MTLIKKIKNSEGFRGEPYKDTLGFNTIGYGTKLPLNEEESLMLLEYRLNKTIKELIIKKPILVSLSENRQSVIYEMAYQLGVNGVLKFKNMWMAIENDKFALAADEMLNSRWHSQTPERANNLSKIMRA